jgi:hypothetical protein
MVLACGFLLQCLLIGYATILLIYRSRSVSWPFAMGFGIAIGCCEVSLVFFYAGLAGVRPCQGTLFAVDAAAIFALMWLHHTKCPVMPRWPADWGRKRFWANWHGYALPAALAGYVGVTALRIVATTPLIEWDAWMIWLYKAKVLAADKLIPPPWVFSSPSGFGHPHYPLLWPLLAAGIFGVTGTTNDHLARIVPVFLWCSCALMTYSALRWKLPRLPATLLAALLVSLPVMTQYTADGDADVQVAVFYMGMVGLILHLWDDARWPDLISAALLGTALAFTKNEGMPLACFGAALVLLLAARHGLAKAALMAGAFLGIVVILLAPWYLWSRNFPRTDEDYTSHVSATMNADNLQRLRIILPAFGRELASLDDSAPLWALLLIVALMGWKGIRSVPIRALWALLAAHFLLYIFVYVISPLDVTWLISNTMNRLLIHITPVAILLIGYHWAEIRTANSAHAASLGERPS